MTNPHESDLTAVEVRNRAARGAVSVIGRHAVVRLMAFVGTLVLARLIAPESFGLFVTAQFTVSVLQALAIGGITSALVRRREAIDPADYRVALTIQQCLTVIVVAGLFAVSPWLAAHYALPDGRIWIFQAMALTLFPLSLRSIPVAMMQRGLRHDLVTLCEVTEYLVYLIVSVGLALLGWGVWALVVATMARNTVGAIVVHALAKARPRFGFGLKRASALLKFALPLQGQMLIDLAQRSVIPVVIGLLLGVGAVGIAGMANTMLEALVLQPLVMLGSVQLRLFARIQNDPAALAALLEKCFASGAMIFLPVVVLFGIAAPTLMPHLLSPKWSGVGELIFWLTPVAVIQIVSLPTWQASKALGELRAPLVGGLIGLAIQIVVVAVLAAPLGLAAYPIAATVGTLAATIVVFTRVSRRIGANPIRAIVPIVAGLVTAGAIWGAAMLWATSAPWIAAALVGGVVAYVAIVVAFAGAHLAALLRFVGAAAPRRITAGLARVAGLVDRLTIVGRART